MRSYMYIPQDVFVIRHLPFCQIILSIVICPKFGERSHQLYSQYFATKLASFQTRSLYTQNQADGVTVVCLSLGCHSQQRASSENFAATSMNTFSYSLRHFKAT